MLASDETNKQRLIEALHNLLLFRSMKAVSRVLKLLIIIIILLITNVDCL